MFTPDNITELKENEIFVFGSNKAGNHAGGAARTAVEKFGAIMGQGEGLQGQSYAFPTLDENMSKVGDDALVESFEKLCDCARTNQDKVFYLTKVGCGIAGFSEEEIIAAINKVELPENIIIPEDFNVVYAFKALDKDFKCRGFQYEVGKEYEEQDAIVCKRGFHACRNPFDVLDYYPLVDENGNMSRFAEVEQSGKIDRSDKEKTCSSKIKIKAELGFPGFVKAAVEWVKEYTSSNKVKDNIASGDSSQLAASGACSQLAASGACSQLAASGAYSQLAASGDSSKLAASGASSKLAASGASSKLAASGAYSQLAASGDSSQLAASGAYSQLAASGAYSKIQSTGSDSVIMCAGNNCTASAKKGSWITLSEWDFDHKKMRYVPICVKTEYVDGDRIKEDTLYKLVNGKFEEEK